MNRFVVKEGIVTPKRGTVSSAGYDFFSPCDFIVPAQGISEFIDTGVSIELDEDKVLLLFTRSGNGIKKGITLRNNVGVVDSDYFPNTIGTVLVNNSDIDFHVKKGDKIMQGIITKFYRASEEELTTTVRVNGFGSTGN